MRIKYLPPDAALWQVQQRDRPPGDIRNYLPADANVRVVGLGELTEIVHTA